MSNCNPTVIKIHFYTVDYYELELLYGDDPKYNELKNLMWRIINDKQHGGVGYQQYGPQSDYGVQRLYSGKVQVNPFDSKSKSITMKSSAHVSEYNTTIINGKKVDEKKKQIDYGFTKYDGLKYFYATMSVEKFNVIRDYFANIDHKKQNNNNCEYEFVPDYYSLILLFCKRNGIKILVDNKIPIIYSENEKTLQYLKDTTNDSIINIQINNSTTKLVYKFKQSNKNIKLGIVVPGGEKDKTTLYYSPLKRYIDINESVFGGSLLYE